MAVRTIHSASSGRAQPAHDRGRRPSRRALGHGAFPAASRVLRRRRRRRGRSRCLRGAAGRRGLRPPVRPAWAGARPGRLQAAHPRRAGAGLPGGDRPSGRLVGRRHARRGPRRARHARDEHRGSAPRGLEPGSRARLRAHRRLPGVRAGPTRPGGLEGRTGSRPAWRPPPCWPRSPATA